MKTKTVIRLALWFPIIGAAFLLAQAQPEVSTRKFDQFWYLRTSEEKARLDLYAKELRNHERAIIVGYRDSHYSPGSFARTLEGYRRYLVDAMSVAPERLEIIDAGASEQPRIELWLVSRAESLPVKPAPHALELTSPLLFDSISTGLGCVGEYTLTPEEPEDALRIFAAALKNNPTAIGYILVHPSTREPARHAKQLMERSLSLLHNAGIARARILGFVEASRRCTTVDLWLMSSDLVIPAATTPKKFFQSQRILEAERERFLIRRVEFVGNDYTRDNVLRRQIYLQEGERFTTELLKRSLTSLSRLKIIRPVSINDVEVTLDRRDRIVDIELHVNERRRGR